jgi:hypothetical protein
MNNQNKKDFISINEYLDNVNLELIKNVSRVIGEVTEVQMYPGRSYLFFKMQNPIGEFIDLILLWTQY